jgi:hypothetical protein
MKQQFLKNFQHMDLVVVGQLLFFAVFVAALLWVFRSGSKGFYEKLSALPFEGKEARDE